MFYFLTIIFCFFCILLFLYFYNYNYIQFYYLLKKHNKKYSSESDLQIVIPKKFKDFKKLYEDFCDFEEESKLLHYIYDKNNVNIE